jgi:hypothetical protein
MEMKLIYKSFCSSGVKACFRKTLNKSFYKLQKKNDKVNTLGLRPRLFFHNHYINLGLRPRLFFHNQYDTSDYVLDRLKVSDN